MSHYINMFLKTEITCIPRLLHKYAGDYYNNTISNGATWLFFAWCLLHCTFNSLFKAFFKRMGCKSFVTERLTQSLWYLGFYSAALMYCGASLIRSEFLDSNYRILLTEHKLNATNDLIVGFLFLITFYIHTSVWEGFVAENFLLGLNYLLLVLATMTAHYMRSVETAFGLSAAISAAHVSIELARIVQLMASYESKANRLFTKGFFILSLLFVLVIYAVALPVSILLPLGLKILQEPSVAVIVFIIFCMMWLAVEVISSPIYRLAEHWIFHMDTEKNSTLCPSCFAECSLFLPRDDVIFTLKIYRQRMKEEQERLMALRKPKNRNNMLVQTLKCMVAIRRKINQKRLSESSDSDESERSESEPKGEPLVKEEDADSESEEELENADKDAKKREEVDGVTIEEITNHEMTGDTEEIVDGKLQIRVKEKREIKSNVEDSQ